MHFIAKPFNLAALAEKVREVLADAGQHGEDTGGGMSETIEHAREGLHHAHHAPAHTDTTARRIAVLIAVLAAALALAEMGEKGAQNAYLTHHIAVSDDWAFYQAKNARATTWAAQAGILANLPNAADAGPTGGDQARQGERGTAARRAGRRRDEAARRTGDRPAGRSATRRSIDTTSSSWWSGRCRSPSCWHLSPW